MHLDRSEDSSSPGSEKDDVWSDDDAEYETDSTDADNDHPPEYQPTFTGIYAGKGNFPAVNRNDTLTVRVTNDARVRGRRAKFPYAPRLQGEADPMRSLNELQTEDRRYNSQIIIIPVRGYKRATLY